MKKSSNKIVLKYIFKVIISSVVSLLLFSSLFSYIIYKADLSVETAVICSLFIIAFSSFTITFVSVCGQKNNGVLTGLISQIPLIIYSLLNTVFNDNSWVLFLIKLVLILLISSLTGYVVVLKGARLKIR